MSEECNTKRIMRPKLIDFNRENNNMKGLTMKRQSRKTHRMVVASVLTGLFFVQQTMTLNVLAASTITDHNGNNILNGGVVNPEKIINGNAYRRYQQFNVGDNDTVNLNFTKDGATANNFLNLVNNDVTINGVLNSVKDGGTYHNGAVTFLTPNGFAIGRNGVVNVGSLGVYTVAPNTFNTIYNNTSVLENNLPYLMRGNAMNGSVEQSLKRSDGDIAINGFVITTDDVNLQTFGSVDVPNTAGIATGVNENKRALVTTQGEAIDLFSQLVRAENLRTSAGDQFAASNGTIRILGTSGVNIAGDVVNYGANGNTLIQNQASLENGGYITTPGSMVLSGSVRNRSGNLNIENSAGDLIINDNARIYNKGTTRIGNKPFTTPTNNGPAADTNTGLYINDASIENIDGKLSIQNTGEKGLNINQLSNISNDGGDIEIYNGYGLAKYGNPEDFSLNDYTNNTGGLNLNGRVSTTNGGNLKVINTDRGVDGLNITTGETSITGTSDYINEGAGGLNVDTTGNINGTGKITMVNTSPNHVVNSANGTEGGLVIKGFVTGNDDISLTSNGSNVVIGDESTHRNNYIAATGRGSVDITANDGSILNYGVNKVLIRVAHGDLDMTANNGSIGQPVQQGKCSGTNCTGIGVKTDGTRDFTKSINADVDDGLVSATTTDSSALKNNDYVINYAAIDSDMNIDKIQANGRVILTVDSSEHAGIDKLTPLSARNNMKSGVNDTNVEGWGMSLISNGSIGTASNKLKFIQNKASAASMDALANENIYLKENSYNDSAYGPSKEIKQNEVCSMVAREGDLDVEFAGDTNIENITAEGDLKVVTRGQVLNIKNLGAVDRNDDGTVKKNTALRDANGIYQDYFGTSKDQGDHDGWTDQGYDQTDYMHDILPDNAVVKALDINHNIRTDITKIEQPEVATGEFDAYANSSVTIKRPLHIKTIPTSPLQVRERVLLLLVGVIIHEPYTLVMLIHG